MNESEDTEIERLKRKKMKEIMEEERGPDFPDSSIKLTDNNFQDIINRYPLVVVDFWADWCAPCKSMEPILEELAEKYSGKIVFGKVNVDQEARIPKRFQVSGIPNLVVFKNGDPVDRIVGMAPKQKLESRLTKHLD